MSAGERDPWLSGGEEVLLNAIAACLRNEVTIMQALSALSTRAGLSCGIWTDLRLRTQQTIKLLDEIDALSAHAESAAADEPERKPPEPP